MAIEIRIFSENSVFDETITDRYIIKTLSRDDQLASELDSSSSKRTFTLTRDCPYTLPILSWNGKDDSNPPQEDSIDLHVVISDGSTPLFTGYLSDKISWGIDTHGANVLTLTAEDMGTHLLKKPYSKDKSKLIEGTFSECLEEICGSDISLAPTVPTISTNVSCVAESGESCESLLKALCKEFGYAYYFQADGRLNLKELSVSNIGVTEEVDDSDLYDSIELNKKARQYRGSRIEWKKLAERQEALIYRDITKSSDAPSTAADCWIPLNVNQSYPANTPTTIKATDLKQGAELFAIKPNTLVPHVEWGRGDGVSTIQQDGADDIKVMCTCISTGGLSKGVISKLEASATIEYVESNEVVYGNVEYSSDNLYESECRWIHDYQSASKYANFCAQYWQYSSNTFTFKTKENYSLGQIIKLKENLHTGLTTYLMIQRVRTGGVSDVKTYEAVSTSEFQYDKQTETQSVYVPPTSTYVEVPDVSEILEEVKDFRLDVIPSNLIADRRRTDNQEIHISTVKKGYENYSSTLTTIYYWYGDEGEESARYATTSSITIFLPYNHKHSSLNVRAVLTDDPSDPTQRVILAERSVALETIDKTDEYVYYGQFNIDTEDFFDADGQLIPENYGQVDWSPVEALLDSNEQFLQGDSFFNNYLNGSFEDVYIYVYENGKWTPMSFSVLSNSELSRICAQAQKDVLSTIRPGSVTKSDFGYFNTVIAGTVTADYIGGQEIELQSGGIMYGGDVDLTQDPGQRVSGTGSGFCFDSLGNAEMSNIRITGDSTIEGGSTVLGTIINYDSNSLPVFKTVKESEANITFSGSKADGTSTPNAYLWNEFWSYFWSYLTGRMSTGTVYSGSGTINGKWSGNSIVSRSIIGAKYYSSAPSSTATTTRYTSSTAIRSNDTSRVVYRNNNIHIVTLKTIYMHCKTEGSVLGRTGWGGMRVRHFNSSGTERTTFCNISGDVAFRTEGRQTAQANNVILYPGDYIVADWYGFDPPALWNRDSSKDGNGYVDFTYVDSENFTQGINLIISGGYIYNATIIPDAASFSTYPQSISLPGASVSINMAMNASSSWPVEKYYGFDYTQSPSTSSTVTSSIFQSQSFSYRGVTKTIISVTYSSNYLKAISSDGNVYEFTTSQGNFYPRHSFSFTTLSESLGAYARSVLPTDDPNTHNLGASTNYDSGNSQRWNTGFFRSLDILEGLIAPSINAGWHVETITANTTLTDTFVVGSMRPYYVMSGGASGPTITMPGDSSQSYTIFSFRYAVAVVAGSSCVARDVVAGGGTLSTSSYVSASQPWCLLLVMRTA